MGIQACATPSALLMNKIPLYEVTPFILPPLTRFPVVAHGIPELYPQLAHTILCLYIFRWWHSGHTVWLLKSISVVKVGIGVCSTWTAFPECFQETVWSPGNQLWSSLCRPTLQSVCGRLGSTPMKSGVLCSSLTPCCLYAQTMHMASLGLFFGEWEAHSS